MADPDRKKAAKPIKVSKATIDSMRRMGMNKAIEKANTYNAPAEFVEGAKRMYGKRINTPGGVGKKPERPMASMKPKPENAKGSKGTEYRNPTPAPKKTKAVYRNPTPKRGRSGGNKA